MVYWLELYADNEIQVELQWQKENNDEFTEILRKNYVGVEKYDTESVIKNNCNEKFSAPNDLWNDHGILLSFCIYNL